MHTTNEKALRIEIEVNKVIKGLPKIVRLVTIAMFAQGHILLEGLPGVAKTTLLRAFSKTISGGFSRISGTPDLMPMEFLFNVWPRFDEIFDDETAKEKNTCLSLKELSYYLGPLLVHGENLGIVLLDEINRIQSKTQSMFLEVMQEKTITCGSQRFNFPDVLFVATRNPLETEETFELPEAQRDRFMFEGEVSRPGMDSRKELITDPVFQNIDELISGIKPVTNLGELRRARKEIQSNVWVSPELADYILRLSEATWEPAKYAPSVPDIEDLNEVVRAGFSPRAEIMLAQAGRVVAWMKDRDYVLPEDIQNIFFEVCSHRYFLNRNWMKRRAGLAKHILSHILKKVPAPKAAA